MTGLFGPAYSSAGPPFAILMVASAIAMVTTNYTSLAMATGQERTFALSVTVASIVNVLLNLLLIPLYGTIGAAIATVAAELLILLICARRVISVIGTPLARGPPHRWRSRGDRGDVGSVDRDTVEHFGVATHRSRRSGISRHRGGLWNGPPRRSCAPTARNMTEPQKRSAPGACRPRSP